MHPSKIIAAAETLYNVLGTLAIYTYIMVVALLASAIFVNWPESLFVGALAISILPLVAVAVFLFFMTVIENENGGDTSP
jgi:hypothetical protein